MNSFMTSMLRMLKAKFGHSSYKVKQSFLKKNLFQFGIFEVMSN